MEYLEVSVKFYFSIFVWTYLHDYLESDGQMVHRYNLNVPIESFAHGYPGPKGLEVQFLNRGIFFSV